MASRYTSQNLQEICKFPFRDEKWKSKFAILGFISIVSILIIPGFFFWGYIYEIMRRVIVDKDEIPTLPDWDDLGIYFKNGFRMFGVLAIYTLPTLLLMIPYFVTFLPMMFSDPAPSDYEQTFLITMPITFGLMMIGTVIGFVMQLLSIVAIGHMIAKDEFRAAFRIREWWPIFRKNIGGYLLAYILFIGASYVIGFAIQMLIVTIILCMVVPVLWIAIYNYLGVIGSVLFAQAYNDGVEKSAS